MKKNYFILTIAFVCFCLGVVGGKHSMVRAQDREAAKAPCYANKCCDLLADCSKICWCFGQTLCFDGKGKLKLPEGCKIVGTESVTSTKYSAKLDCNGDKKADWSFVLNMKCAKDCGSVTGTIQYIGQTGYPKCTIIKGVIWTPQSSGPLNSQNRDEIRSLVPNFN